MRFKHWLFRHYVWSGLVVAVGALVFVRCIGWYDKPYVIGGIVASVLSFFYFVQRQRLEETRLFKELFTSFNERYDKLNDKLATIERNTAFDDATRDTLIDYFNLCAEEYLFYEEGYILHDVWRAWCRGMLQYMELPPVADLWRKEEATGSYYELTLEQIKLGAQ